MADSLAKQRVIRDASLYALLSGRFGGVGYDALVHSSFFFLLSWPSGQERRL